jgi:hypothetical protein
MLYEKASFCSFQASNCARTLTDMAPNEPGDTRRANLKQLLENRFRGRIADMSRVLERSDAYLWQLLNAKRNMGERIARHVEGKLELPRGALDAGPDIAEQPRAGYELSGKAEILVHLFSGLFSHQQRELINDMHALFQANQITRKELGQKPLRGVSDAQIESSFGHVPLKQEHKKRPRTPGREPGTAMDDFLE